MKDIFLYGHKFRYPRGDLVKQMLGLIYILLYHPSPLDTRTITTTDNKRVKRKKISFKTYADRKQCLLRIAIDLMTLFQELRYLTEIKRAHVMQLLLVWKKRKIGVSATKNSLCFLRTALWFIGVDVKHVVPSNKAALAYMSLPSQRCYVTANKTWESRGINPWELIQSKVMKEDPLVGAVLLLCFAFGLRLKEGMLWNSGTGIGVQGNLINILHGAKGGRKRIFSVDSHMLEKMAIRYASRFINPVTDSLVPGTGKIQDKDLMKFRRRIYSVARRCGITKKGLGVCIHGLRHSAACRWFSELTGTQAPILGGGPIDAALDRKARAMISRRLGHVRLNIVDIYCGRPNVCA